MKQYNSWQGYKRLLTFIKPYKTRLVFAVICMALSGASNVRRSLADQGRHRQGIGQ